MKLWPTTTENKCFVTCVRWMCKSYCTFGLFKWHCSYSSYRVFFFFFSSIFCFYFLKKYIYKNQHVGTSYLKGTVEAVWDGPTAQWPNPRTLTGPRMVSKGDNGSGIKGRTKSFYGNSQPIRGEESPWNFCSRWFETFLSF